MNTNDYYSTTDLTLATVVAMHLPVDVIDKNNPNKVVFIFKREKALEQLVEDFWKRSLRVEPLAFFNCMKMLKSRIYEK